MELGLHWGNLLGPGRPGGPRNFQEVFLEENETPSLTLPDSLSHSVVTSDLPTNSRGYGSDSQNNSFSRGAGSSFWCRVWVRRHPCEVVTLIFIYLLSVVSFVLDLGRESGVEETTVGGFWLSQPLVDAHRHEERSTGRERPESTLPKSRGARSSRSLFVGERGPQSCVRTLLYAAAAS